MEALAEFSCEKCGFLFMCGIIGLVVHCTYSPIMNMQHHWSCCTLYMYTVPLCSLIGPIVTIVTPLIHLHNHIIVDPHTKCTDSVLSMTYVCRFCIEEISSKKKLDDEKLCNSLLAAGSSNVSSIQLTCNIVSIQFTNCLAALFGLV